MKYTIIVALLGAAQALRVRGGPAAAAPAAAAGAGYVDNADGWREWGVPEPAKNTCVNVNKLLGTEQPCDTPGNSAWNTLTTSRTGSQTNALAPPYPDHLLH